MGAAEVAAERERIIQSNDVSGIVAEAAARSGDQFIVVTTRFDIADALYAAGYRKVVTPDDEVPVLADDCDCEDREALVRPEGLVCGTCDKLIEAR